MTKYTKHFRDSVWGEIKVSKLACSIIDTFEFQRLHHIKQTGLAYKVFPTATSSRFEHSIGVYHVTKLIIESVERDMSCSEKLSVRKKELIAIIGLLHDIGHGPLSHLFDDFLQGQENVSIPSTHEERSCVLFRKMVERENLDFSEEEVEWITTRILCPPNEHWYDTLVCNPYSSFDTDKIDYLRRDCKHFGIIINFDWDRILQNMRVIDNKLCFCEKIYQEIENLFILREQMHSSIYRHPTIEKFQNFLLQYMKTNPSYFIIPTMDDFVKWNDVSIFFHLPFQVWKEMECRSWKGFHDIQQNIKYSDHQRQNAMKNTLWYKRSEPHVSFHKKI